MMKMLVVCMQAALAAASGTPDSQGWTSQDIGKVTARGSATHDEKTLTWTLRGDGSDVFDTADSFLFVYRPYVGDSSIVAKVESIGEAHPWAKVGVMIRETLDPTSRCAFLYATPANGVSAQVRPDKAGKTLSDNFARTKEQQTLKAPVWIKLERRGDQFRGYYAADGPGRTWIPLTWKPEAVPMSKAVYVGLAVTSHRAGALCEAMFSKVAVAMQEGMIAESAVLTSPDQARIKAYQNLEQLGPWRQDAGTIEKQQNLIGSSLFVIARARELAGEPKDQVLLDYYRTVEILPASSSAVDALIRIALLEEEKGLRFGMQHVESRAKEDQDKFYLAVLAEYGKAPETPARETAVRSFVEYVAKTGSLVLLEQAIDGLAGDPQAASTWKSLILHSMALPANEPLAVRIFRYTAVRLGPGRGGLRMSELAPWAVLQFPNTKLAACALAVLADAHYDQGHYVEAVEVFQPGLFSPTRSESKIVEAIDTIVPSYSATTLLPRAIDRERIYQALGQKAGMLGLRAVTLHCQKKIAENKGLSLEDFERAAQKGVKYCDSPPENEIWFWKGFLAAGAGDLGKATAAYEHFLSGDSKSVLAARAYYDLARAKMAVGEEAGEWITKAKALSPCEAVVQLERKLSVRVSPPR